MIVNFLGNLSFLSTILNVFKQWHQRMLNFQIDKDRFPVNVYNYYFILLAEMT